MVIYENCLQTFRNIGVFALDIETLVCVFLFHNLGVENYRRLYLYFCQKKEQQKMLEEKLINNQAHRDSLNSEMGH